MEFPAENPYLELVLDSHRKASDWFISFLNKAGLVKGYSPSDLETSFISDEAMADKSLWQFSTNTHEESDAYSIFNNKRTVLAFYLDPALGYSDGHQVYYSDRTGLRGGILVFESEWKMRNKHMFEGFKGQEALPDVFKENLEDAIKELPLLDEKNRLCYGLPFAATLPEYKLKYTKEYKSTPFKELKRGLSLSMPFTEQSYDVQAKVLKHLNARLDVFNNQVRDSEVFQELERRHSGR